MQFRSMTFVQRHFRSNNVNDVVFAYNFSQKRDRAMQTVSLCLAGQDTSIDMHINLLL